ncbi:dihydroneopterin aldolase [Euzebya sp.]|uniref:dihydroneopterin aldolase n=1 Tax=Euzebya sp. TaxID=1971409 RepID=UPI003512FD72
MDVIEIKGLRVVGHHGVFDFEKADGQTFVIDATLDVDLSAASRSDDLDDTVNYGVLAETLADAVASTRFDLIERLAGHLLDLIMADPRVAGAQVRIAKPDAPVAADLDEVAVCLRRRRA